MMLDYIFKGYVESKGKTPLHKYSDEENLITYNTARTKQSYMGILHDDYVVIDVDNSENADKLFKIVSDLKLKCNVLQTTRGMHFYFLNLDLASNKINRNTPIGIPVDIGIGLKNKPVALKVNDKIRPWLLKYNSVDYVPKWLYPIGYDAQKFNNLDEGDGRNQELFNYILTLQKHGLTKEEIITTINIINTYILKTPLKQREVDTILRDDAFLKKIFFKKNNFMHHEFSKYIKDNSHIIKIGNMLHIYKEGVYSDQLTDIESSMINYIPQLKKAMRQEVLAYLTIICEEKKTSSVNLLAFKNGIYDIKTSEVINFSPNIIIKNQINFNYDPDSYNETVDKVFDKITCNNSDLRLLLEEVIGYLLLRRNELGKCFILTGSGSNGKSTFLNMLKTFLSKNNYSSLGLEELNNRFKTAEVFGKLANIGDDISNLYIENNAIFKKLVTGESINVERKGKDPFEFENYAKLVFSANKIPRINDTSDGLLRRLVIIPFNATFKRSDADFDPFIKDKLLTDSSMEYMLTLAVEGLNRVLNNNGFTECEEVKKELEEYEKMNNPLISFVEEYEGKIANNSTKDVYLKYSTWCVENKLMPLSQIHFSRELCRKYNFDITRKRVKGNRVRIFIQKTVNKNTGTDRDRLGQM